MLGCCYYCNSKFWLPAAFGPTEKRTWNFWLLPPGLFSEGEIGRTHIHMSMSASAQTTGQSEYKEHVTWPRLPPVTLQCERWTANEFLSHKRGLEKLLQRGGKNNLSTREENFFSTCYERNMQMKRGPSWSANMKRNTLKTFRNLIAEFNFRASFRKSNMRWWSWTCNDIDS